MDGIYCTPYEADYFAHPELVVGLPDWPREGHQPTARVFHDVCTEHTEQICMYINMYYAIFPQGFLRIMSDKTCQSQVHSGAEVQSRPISPN